MACNCAEKPGVDEPQHPSTPSTKAQQATPALPEKRTCPKCHYYMALTVYPATREKKFICQSSMCRYSMEYALP